MGILQQRTASDGYRRTGGLEEREEVGYILIRQLRPEEVPQDRLIGGIAQRYLVEVVTLHEFIEDIRTQDDRLGDAHLDILKLVELGVTLDDIIQERQSSALSSQRTVTDTGEMTVGVELIPAEKGYHTDILHPSVLHDGVEDNLTVGIHILQFLPGHGLEECRHREDCPGTQPATHVVAGDMIEHRIVRYQEDIILQLLEVTDTGDLLMGLRVTEDKVAEAHVLLQQLTQVDIHLLAVLVHKLIPILLRLLPIGTLTALQDQWDIGVAGTDGMEKFQSGLSVFLYAHTARGPAAHRLNREPTVADHT